MLPACGLQLAENLDISLEETGDALVDHAVSCVSLLTAAAMLSCNSIVIHVRQGS